MNLLTWEKKRNENKMVIWDMNIQMKLRTASEFLMFKKEIMDMVNDQFNILINNIQLII